MVTIVTGIILTLMGIGLIYWRIKSPMKKSNPLADNFRMLVGGVFISIMGLLFIKNGISDFITRKTCYYALPQEDIRSYKIYFNQTGYMPLSKDSTGNYLIRFDTSFIMTSSPYDHDLSNTKAVYLLPQLASQYLATDEWEKFYHLHIYRSTGDNGVSFEDKLPHGYLEIKIDAK